MPTRVAIFAGRAASRRSATQRIRSLPITHRIVGLVARELREARERDLISSRTDASRNGGVRGTSNSVPPVPAALTVNQLETVL